MNKDVAKQLLKKGIALGDQELINMANEMLDDVPNTLWFCDKCEDTFDNSKNRKSCPKCKSRKISITQPINPTSEIESADDFSMVGDENRPKGMQVDGRNFQPKRLTKELASVSESELAKEVDISIDTFKMVKEKKIAKSRRPAAKQREYICNFCNRKILSWIPLAGTFHVCNRCGNR